MSSPLSPTHAAVTPRRAVAVAATYAAQAFGTACVFNALPTFESRWGLSDAIVSAILLGCCVAAAGGSLVADAIAVRRGSRQAVVIGFSLEAIGILLTVFAPLFPVFVIGVAVFGLGLGTVDASSNMQGVLLEARAARPVLGRLYAVFTAFAILGALAMSGSIAVTGLAAGALLLAVVLQLTTAALGWAFLDRSAAAREVREESAPRPRLPRGAIWAVGAIVLVAYVLDSSISSWSAIYLQHGLAAAAAVAPLGYAVYQGAVLVSRLATDALERRLGRIRLALAAIVVGFGGCAVVAAIPVVGGAIAGFAVAGLATGALIPLAFSAAGELLPVRSDEIIARVNLFNYAGVVFGAVLLGLVSTGPQLGPAFLIPGFALIIGLPLLRVLRRRTVVPATATAEV